MEKLIAEILEISRKNPAGFTIDLNTLQYVPSGYSVAYEATQDSFGIEGLTKVIEHAQAHEGYIGGWRSGDDYYFDSVMIVQDEKEAIRLGKANHQIAICKLKPLRVIEIKY